MGQSLEAVSQLIVSGGDGAVYFELTQNALDAIAALVERPGHAQFSRAGLTGPKLRLRYSVWRGRHRLLRRKSPCRRASGQVCAWVN